jgi:AraC-like DNA-binding protein
VPDTTKIMAERASSEHSEAPRDRSTTFMSGFVTRGVLISFRILGLDPELVCARSGVSLVDLMDPASRVPRGVIWSLFMEAERLSGDSSIGLRVAQAIPAGAGGGIVSQMATVSETGLAAIRHLARYHKLIADGLEIQLREEDATLVIELTPAERDDALVRQAMEAFVGGIWKAIDEAMIQPLVPVRVSFRHAPPSKLAPYEEFFGCPVEFGAVGYCLRFPLSALEQEMIAAQPRAESRLRELAESELRLIAPEFTVAVSEKVRTAIEDHERPTHASTAKRLGIGQRTLQRRLREEGSSFRMIVDRERRDLALAMLREPARRVVDVALAIGFDDATSFAKAFRRWTGQTPTAYRAQAAGQTS